MLCVLCEVLLNDILHNSLGTWRRLGEDWFTYRHGDFEAISASAAAGCRLCNLFSLVREQEIPGFQDLAEKWKVQHAMVDVRLSAPYAFQLLTEAPNKSWISFELFRPAESSRVENDLLGDQNREVLQTCEIAKETDAHSNVLLARSWIEQCQHEHPQCIRPDKQTLPTRVLDVGHPDVDRPPRIQVNHGQQGQYVTLSHCWGTSKRLTTTKRKLKEFQEAIPCEDLPATFRDAVRLTRALGMQYLWIDALCIVQDDIQDWRRESATMCSVYENAAFSISALSSVDSASGIFRERQIEQCIVPIQDTRVGIRLALDDCDSALAKSKLESRAWCLQERILAPAILHVGPQQLFWECRTMTVSESSPDRPTSGSYHQKAVQISRTHIPMNGNRDQLLELWYSLVARYSARELSHPSDRLPAISGLADKIRREIGGSIMYVFGIWLDDLATGLLWQRPMRRGKVIIPSRDSYTPQTTHIQARSPRDDQTPSWSWASIRGAVDYAWQSDVVNYTMRQDFVLKSRFVQGESLLQLEGFIKTGTCRLISQFSIGNAGFKPSGSSVTIDSIACILDDSEEVISKQCYCLRIATFTPPRTRTKRDSSISFYLILERVREDNGQGSRQKLQSTTPRYRRIGMGRDSAEKVNKVFANSELHVIELI